MSKKISQLPASSSLNNSDLMELSQVLLGIPTSTKVTLLQLAAFFGGGATKIKVASSATVASLSITLPNTPSFIFSIEGNGTTYQLTDDYTISAAIITFTNPSISNGDKVYYKYEY